MSCLEVDMPFHYSTDFRRRACELLGLERCPYLLALDLTEGSRLRYHHSFGPGRERTLPMSAIPSRATRSECVNGSCGAHDLAQLVDGFVDHGVSLVRSAVLVEASVSRSAESFA